MKPPKRQKSTPASAEYRRESGWTLLEKKQLLGALKLHPKDDIKSIKMFIPTRSENEIEFYISRMWIKSKVLEDPGVSDPQMREPAPIENWLETMQALTKDEMDYSFVLTNIMSIAGNLEPHYRSSRPNSLDPDYTAIYRYITALLRGTTAPKLDKLNAAVVLDLLQGLSNHIRTLDTEAQRRLMLEKVKLLNTKVNAQNPKASKEFYRRAMEEDMLSSNTPLRNPPVETTLSHPQVSASTITVEPQPSTSRFPQAETTVTSEQPQLEMSDQIVSLADIVEENCLDTDVAQTVEIIMPSSPQHSPCTVTMEPQTSSSGTSQPEMTTASDGLQSPVISFVTDAGQTVVTTTPSNLEHTADKIIQSQQITMNLSAEISPNTSSLMYNDGKKHSDNVDTPRLMDDTPVSLGESISDKRNAHQVTVMTLSDGTVVLAEYDEEEPKLPVNTSENSDTVVEKPLAQTSKVSEDNKSVGDCQTPICVQMPASEARAEDLGISHRVNDNVEPTNLENTCEMDSPRGNTVTSSDKDISEPQNTEQESSILSKSHDHTRNITLQNIIQTCTQSTVQEKAVLASANTGQTHYNNTVSPRNTPSTLSSKSAPTGCNASVSVQTPMSAKQTVIQDSRPADPNTVTDTALSNPPGSASSSQASESRQNRPVVSSTTQSVVVTTNQTPSSSTSPNIASASKAGGTKRTNASVSSTQSPPKKKKVPTATLR